MTESQFRKIQIWVTATDKLFGKYMNKTLYLVFAIIQFLILEHRASIQHNNVHPIVHHRICNQSAQNSRNTCLLQQCYTEVSCGGLLWPSIHLSNFDWCADQLGEWGLKTLTVGYCFQVILTMQAQRPSLPWASAPAGKTLFPFCTTSLLVRKEDILGCYWNRCTAAHVIHSLRQHTGSLNLTCAAQNCVVWLFVSLLSPTATTH